MASSSVCVAAEVYSHFQPIPVSENPQKKIRGYIKTITIKVTASYQMILRQSYLIQNTRLVKMQLKLYISKLTF